MSFVTEIRILKYETPHVHVIISPTLVTVVEFDDDDSKCGDWTPHYDVEKPPAEMTLAELEAVADFVLTDVGFKGPRRRLGPVTDGAGDVVEVDTTTPLGPPAEVEAPSDDELAAMAQKYADTLVPEAEPEPAAGLDVWLSEPVCVACSDKGYVTESTEDGYSRARVCECPKGQATDLRAVAAELARAPGKFNDLAIVSEEPVADDVDELGPVAPPEEMTRRQRLAARVLQHVGTPTDKRPPEVVPVIAVRGTEVFIDGQPATPEQAAKYATEIIKAAGVTLIGAGTNGDLPVHTGKPIGGKWPMPKPDTKARGKVTIHRLIPITDSSIVGHVGYDPVTCTLEVGIIQPVKAPKTKMKSKRKPKAQAKPVKPKIIRYRFKDVPAEILVGITTAASAGVYFNEMVKPHYVGRRVP